MEADTVDALAQISFLVQRALQRCAGQYELSVIQTRLLGLLRDGAPTMNELAQRLGLDKSSASGLVDRAQRRGLVRRVPSQIDRRSVRVRLTESGRSLAQEVAAASTAELSAILDPLPPDERARLTSCVDQLLAHAHGLPPLESGSG